MVLWQSYREEGTVGMLAVNDADEFGKFVWINFLEVVVFVDVVLEIIEERLTMGDDELPVALTNANDLRRPVAHLPIKKVVLLLTF